MPAARKKAARAKPNRKPTLSPTRITTYLECAVKYRYIYLDKIGRFYLRAKPYFSFGSTLHHVLQNFHEQGATHSTEELVSELAETWIGAGYETTEQEQKHREAGEQIVQAYHTAHQERVLAQTETIATEKTISWDMGNFRLSGRVDRIDRHADGRLEILDYKSGRWETTPEEVANDLAMCCYQLILQRLHPETSVFATIYCLRSGVQASAQLDAEQLDEFEHELRVLGNQILEQDYTDLEPVPVPACPTCDFLPRCERFWQQKARLERLDVSDFDEEEGRFPVDEMPDYEVE